MDSIDLNVLGQGLFCWSVLWTTFEKSWLLHWKRMVALQQVNLNSSQLQVNALWEYLSRGFASELHYMKVLNCSIVRSRWQSLNCSKVLCFMHYSLCTMQKVLSLQVWEGGDGQGLRFACQAYLPSSPPISWISETDDGCFGKFLIGTRVDAGRARRPRRKEKRQIKISGCTEVSGPQLGICGRGGMSQISY